MDSNDAHFYCCGECQALFSTLRTLSKHKLHCNGKKNLSVDGQMYAYSSEYLQKLLRCCTSCYHSETCPILTCTPILTNERDSKMDGLDGQQAELAKKMGIGTHGSSPLRRGRPPKMKREALSNSSPGVRIVNQAQTSTVPRRRRGRPRKVMTSGSSSKESGPENGPEMAESKAETEEVHGGETVDASQLLIKDIPSDRDASDPLWNSSPNDGLAVDTKEPDAVSPITILITAASKGQVTSTYVLPGATATDQPPADDSTVNPDITDHTTEESHSVEAEGAVTQVDTSASEKRKDAVHNNLSEDCNHRDVQLESQKTSGEVQEILDSQSDAVTTELEQNIEHGYNTRRSTNSLPQTFPHKNTSSVVKSVKKVPRDAVSGLSLFDQLKQYRQQVGPKDSNSKETFMYVCDVCGWKTVHVGFFARHLRTHNGTTPGSMWECEQCTFRCRTRNELNLHRNKHIRPFMCEFCSNRFTCKKDLLRHLPTHTGELPFKCIQCDYACRQQKSMIEHMRKHTGEALACPVEGCDFTTVYSWALKSHQVNRHVTEKRLRCSICAYCTNDSYSMIRHRRLHAGEKNYKCAQCSFHAVVKHDVVKHMRSHTKEKLFFCDRCDYATSYSSSLRQHLMNHLGVKPWQCIICGYNSITRNKVVRHLRQSHPERTGTNLQELVVNLGLKLDINVSEYRRSKDATQQRIVYDIQDIREANSNRWESEGSGEHKTATACKSSTFLPEQPVTDSGLSDMQMEGLTSGKTAEPEAVGTDTEVVESEEQSIEGVETIIIPVLNGEGGDGSQHLEEAAEDLRAVNTSLLHTNICSSTGGGGALQVSTTTQPSPHLVAADTWGLVTPDEQGTSGSVESVGEEEEEEGESQPTVICVSEMDAQSLFMAGHQLEIIYQ